MVSHLQHVNPDSEVLLVGILPCAAETSPGPEGLFAWPNGLSAGISRVNKALEGFASQQHLVHYVDCTDEMLLQGQVRHQAYSGNPRVTKGLFSHKRLLQFTFVSNVCKRLLQVVFLPRMANGLHHACQLSV